MTEYQPPAPPGAGPGSSPGNNTGSGTGASAGFAITGSTISGSAIAMGAGSRAQQVSYGTDSSGTLAQIDRLLQELREGAAGLEADQAEAVADDVERLEAEIHRRKPDRDSIGLLLGRLAQRVGAAAALLANVEQVRELITALLH